MRNARYAATTPLPLACLVAVALCAVTARAQETQERPLPLFIVEYTTGPAWTPNKPFQEQRHSADHSAHVRLLRERGMLVLGARHGAKGMVVLRSANEAAARVEVEKDPAVAAGVFTVTIEELRPFYGGCIDLPAPPRRPESTP